LPIILVAMAAFACVADVAAQVPDVPGWQLAWHDEFNGGAVDTDNWEVLTRQNSFNDEKQYYLPEQATVVNGNLRITATNQPIANKLYRSARLESWQEFGPGRFEARIDLPTTQGMWPAFWLFPNDPGIPWPTGGEIDILENRGSQPFLVSSAYHWQREPGPCCDQTEFYSEEYTATDDGGDVNFHEGFHTYAVEWDEAIMRFYVNGVLHMVLREASAPNPPIFETPKNIILNLAVGGDFGGNPDETTVFPQVMDVDYVRVWTRQSGLVGDYNGDGVVNAADYTVWRDSLGQTGIGMAADGSGNGTVDQADYEVWKEKFGAAGGASSSDPFGATSVPEPATLWLVGIVVSFHFQRRRRMAVERGHGLIFPTAVGATTYHNSLDSRAREAFDQLPSTDRFNLCGESSRAVLSMRHRVDSEISS
jgi:beta-glucanase (GH16 family)